MMRSPLIFFLWMLAISCSGQQQYKVFDWKSEYTLNTYLLQRVHQQYDERRRSFQQASVSSASMQAYRDSCRARYKRLLGDFPEKTGLKPAITGTIKRKGFRIEKVIYESVPRHHITANLYVPEGKGPFPAVLLFCGHEPQSKATKSYQKTAILFALNGFVVFVIDPISQGERHQLTSKQGKPLTRGGTTEHTLVNAAANLVGSGTVAYSLWDNIRGLDYLTTRPEVDKDRIGCVGNSGGGTQVSYFIGFDDRIKVAAPCSYIASRERNFDVTGANDGCQHVPGEGGAGLEISDFLIMFAPKPLLILAGRYDFVDYEGTLQAYNELQQAYTVFDQKEKVKLFTADDGHGISRSKREAVVTWFRKWLYNDDTPIIENDLETLAENDLRCTPAGQVNSLFTDEVNDFKRISATVAHLKQDRNASSKHLQTAIKAVMNISVTKENVSAEEVGRIRQNGIVIAKIIVRKQEEMPLPLLVAYPSRPARRVILWLEEKGKHHIADSTALLKKYLSEDAAVIMADLGGLGELTDPEKLNDSKYYNKEYRNAMTALHLGSSLPAERVKNILVLLDFVTGTMKGIPVQVYATGRASVPALHAAVVDSRISTIKVYNMISSFEEVILNPMTKDWYSNVIPGVLKYYDIADLRKILGERLLE